MNKLPIQKQKRIFMNYLTFLYHKYHNKELSVNISDLFRLKFEDRVYRPDEFNYSQIIKELEKEEIFKYTSNTTSSGKIYLTEKGLRILAKIQKSILKAQKSISQQKIIINYTPKIYNITNIGIKTEINNIITNINKTTINNKTEVIQKINELENELSLPEPNFSTIKKIIEFLLKNCPPELIQPVIILLLRVFGLEI
jgi:hypothetical protein